MHHPLKGNHAAWHAALNAHPFLLFFTSCSISTFLFSFYHYFITNSLRDVPPRQTHRQNDSPQTDGLDRLLQVPADPVVLVPLLGQHIAPLSVARYPLSIYPEGGADVAVVVLPVPLITVVNGRVLHRVSHGRFGWLSGPGGSEVWSSPPPLVGPTMFSDGSPSFFESNHRDRQNVTSSSSHRGHQNVTSSVQSHPFLWSHGGHQNVTCRLYTPLHYRRREQGSSAALHMECTEGRVSLPRRM